MYVTKRDDKYRAWKRIVVNGEVKRISVTMDKNTAQSRKTASEALRQREIELTRKLSDITYSELVEAYINYQKATVKMSTWTRNESTLLRLADTFGKNKKVEDMTAGFISARLLTKTKEPGTYNEYLKRLKAMFRWAYQHDHIQSAEFINKLKPLKEDMTESQKVADKFLESEELEKILAEASPFYSAIFEFLALSGLRIGELIALEDKDVTDADIIVRQTYDMNNDVVNTPKTEASWRYVHIQPELKDCIRRIRQMSKQHCLVSRKRPPYFVVNVNGGRLSYVNANNTFQSICARVLKRHLTLHSLRHTHVALMCEQGIELRALSQRLGHSDSKITQQIYYHVTEKQRQKDNAAFDSVTIFKKKVIPM